MPTLWAPPHPTPTPTTPQMASPVSLVPSHGAHFTQWEVGFLGILAPGLGHAEVKEQLIHVGGWVQARLDGEGGVGLGAPQKAELLCLHSSSTLPTPEPAVDKLSGPVLSIQVPEAR